LALERRPGCRSLSEGQQCRSALWWGNLALSSSCLLCQPLLSVGTAEALPQTPKTGSSKSSRLTGIWKRAPTTVPVRASGVLYIVLERAMVPERYELGIYG
jgi:hypothetical protein